MKIYQSTEKTFFAENGIEYQATINEFEEVLIYGSKRMAIQRCRTWIKRAVEQSYTQKAHESRLNYEIWRFEKGDGHAIEISLIQKELR